MSRIITIHSFRGGTGKSNITANIAALLAEKGQRVGVVDTDVQSPGIHILFGLAGHDIEHSLNDYLEGTCGIQDSAREVLNGQLPGKIYLIPASTQVDDIVRVLREGYDIRMLTTAMHELINALQLDTLLIDTHPGLNEETLFALAISSTILLVMRPDKQDYEGTAVTLDVARSLEVPRLLLVVNKAPPDLQADALKAQFAESYGCPVAGVLPHSSDMMALASDGIFALRYPDHALTSQLREVTHEVAGA